MRRAVKAGIFGAALIASLFGVNRVVDNLRPSEPTSIVRTTESPSESPRPTTRTEAPSQTVQVTYSPSPSPITTPSPAPSPSQKLPKYGNPCSVPCLMRDDQKRFGYNTVEIGVPEGSDILYVGERGYYTLFERGGTTADILYIFDESGIVFVYTISKDSFLNGMVKIPQYNTLVLKGQKIAVAGKPITTLQNKDSNVDIRVKYFPTRVIGNPEIQAFLQVPYSDIFAEQFGP